MSDKYDPNWERFILICKPEQSGKTFIMIQKIISDLKEPLDNKRIINIIFCDNNLLLTKQTSSRVKNDLAEFKLSNSDELYLEFSSHKRTRFHTAESVIGGLMLNKDCNNILCCTNGIRAEDIYKIIKALNDDSDKYYFKIWLDEADKFIGYINDTFIPLIGEYNNIQTYCITATPKKLFDEFKCMNVLPLENTTCKNYHGWDDNDIRKIDLCSANTCGFAKHVLVNIAPEKIIPGSKWFIPADTKKSSHENIKELCVSMGFAVFVVNGEGIKLTLPDKSLHQYLKDDELNTKLKTLYAKHELNRCPIVITGNICIGRGISIMSNDFMIDYAILSSTNNHQETSQISGRLKGNMKHWPNYKKPIIYTIPKFDKIAKDWEKKSRELAILAFKKDSEGESTIITRTEFKTLGEEYEYIIHDTLFDTYKAASAFLKRKDIVAKMKTKHRESKKNAIHRRLKSPGVDEKKGYALTSKLGLVSEITQDDRITYDRACNPQAPNYIAAGNCISSTDKGSRFLILPVYETLDTPPNKEKYQVRYISFK